MPCSPSARVVAVISHAPSVKPAETVPRESSPENSSIKAPASAVPVKVGVLSLVSWSLLEMPVSESAASAKLSGASGAVVSTVIVTASDRSLALPAASVALAETLCSPSARIVAVTLQSPDASAVTVPRKSSPENSSIVAPASAIPVKVGVLSLVSWPLLNLSVSELAASAKLSGAAGAAVSTVIVTASDRSLTLPATSVAWALMPCSPSTRVAAVKLQPPDASAVTVPREPSPENSSTEAPASAVPVKVGVLSLVSWSVLWISGASGLVVSMVMATASDRSLTLPARSVAWALTPCSPSDSGVAVICQ